MPDYNDEDLQQPQDEQPTPALGEAEELPESVGRRARVQALKIAATVIIVAVTVMVAVGATSSGGSPTKPTSRHKTTTTQGISALLAGIPQNGNTLGAPTAPVTLQYFGDLECSTARAFTLGALPSIIRNWVRSGELRIEYRSLRTVSEPNTFGVQQVAALAAGMQNKLWYYLEYFYHEQGREHTGYVTGNYLQRLARQAPHLNLELWGDDRHDPQLAAQITQDEQVAHTANLYNTPSFLIGPTGSTPNFTLGESTTLSTINEAVQQTLHDQSRRDHHTPSTTTPTSPINSHPHTANITQHARPSTTQAPAHTISNIKHTPTGRQ